MYVLNTYFIQISFFRLRLSIVDVCHCIIISNMYTKVRVLYTVSLCKRGPTLQIYESIIDIETYVYYKDYNLHLYNLIHLFPFITSMNKTNNKLILLSTVYDYQQVYCTFKFT